MLTKEEIIQRMFGQISNDYDKSEGSFIYDAVVSVATALEDGYIEIETILEKAFADTAYDEYLDKITNELGVFRKPAIKASTTLTITGIDGTIIPVGARFFVDSIYFTSTESKTIANGTAAILVECEQPGADGNVPANSIVNFEPILGLESVTNQLPVTNGVNKETDSELRTRYFEKTKTPATSGNLQDYLNWCKEVPGIGDAKVFPLWAGNGTVKCVIINSNKRAVEQSLLDTVISNVESKRPVGATVTIESATEFPIDVSVTVTLSPGADLVTTTELIANTLTEYLKEVAFQMSYVSYAVIGSKIIELEEVQDYTDLLLNGLSTNIPIGNTDVAVVGTVAVT